MANKNNENKKEKTIPLKRPKGVSEAQWTKAKELYQAAVNVGDPAPQLTVAQAALETGWFKRTSGKNNYFGQKATKSQQGSDHTTKEFDDSGKEYKDDLRFRDYDTLEEAMRDRQRLWGSKYKDADSLKGAINSIWSYDEEKQRGTGYATDPDYGNKIENILGMMGADVEAPLDDYTGYASVNPERIANNPKLDDNAKEELLRANESEGLAKNTIQDINAGNNNSILSQYTGNYNLNDIVNQDTQQKEQTQEKKAATQPQQEALGYTGDIGAFASDFNLLNQEFNKGGSLDNGCGGPGQPPCDEAYRQKIALHNKLYSDKIKENNNYYNKLLRNGELIQSKIDSLRLDSNQYRDSLRTDSEKLRHSLLNQQFKTGGSLDARKESNLVTEYNTGGSHEENPNGGIPVGKNEQGGTNLVEQGETRHQDYIYSNAYKLSKKDANRFNLHPRYIGKSFSDISKDINQEIKQRPYDRITKRTAEGNLNKLMMAQESVKASEEPVNNNAQQFEEGGTLTPQGIAGLAGTALSLGQTAFGDTGIDTSGRSGRQEKQNVAMGAAGSALQGASAGAALGPWGAAIGGAIGLGAGLIGGDKANKDTLEANRNAALIQNNEFRNTFAHGGLLHTEPTGKTKKTEGDTELDKQDVQNVNASTGVKFTEQGANSLFEKMGIQPATAGPDVNFGRYSDVNYFRLGNTDGDVVRIQNTENNPHNPHTMRPVMEELQKLNPNTKLQLEYRQYHKGGKLHQHPHDASLPVGAVGRTKDGKLIITGNQPWRHYNEPTILESTYNKLNAEQTAQKQNTGVDFPAPAQTGVPPIKGGTYVQDVMNEYATADYSQPNAAPELVNKYPISKNRIPQPGYFPVAEQPAQTPEDTFTPGENIKYDALDKRLNELAGSHGLSDTERNQMTTDTHANTAISGLKSLQGLYKTDTGLFNTAQQGVKDTPKDPATAATDPGTEETAGGSNFKMGELLRYAPTIGNTLQLMNLPKAEVERYDRLDNRYVPQYMDERALENRAAQSGANTRRSLLGASGGSQSAARASLLGSQVHESQNLSDSMFQAQQHNNQQDQIAQQFNLGVDQTNQRIGMQETVANAQNRAARDTRKQQLTQGIFNDLGEMGKEAHTGRTLENLTGYNTTGERAQKIGLLSSLVQSGKDAGDPIYDLAVQLLNNKKKTNGN